MTLGLLRQRRTVNLGAMTSSNTPPPNPLATPEPWDLVTSGYVADSLPYFEAFSREALRLAALKPGAHIVDVAAGPGTLSLLAAAASARVTAIDVSERMIEEFRR